MWDRRNNVVVRTGFVAASATSTVCDIVAGETGVWCNNGVWTVRNADGTDSIIQSDINQRVVLAADVVIESNLAGYVYANGTAGVGATLTAGANNQFGTYDGVTSVLNYYYLVQAQTTPAQSGLYKLTTLGTAGTKAVLTRAVDFDTADEMKDGVLFVVTRGTARAGTLWECEGDVTTVGTTAVVIARQADVCTLATAQTITGVKSFADGTDKIMNAAGTFGSVLKSGATADRNTTFPDQAGTVVAVTTAPTGAGQLPRSSGAGVFTSSTSTFPDTVTGAGRILRASGANIWAESTSTYPDTVTGAGQIIRASGANAFAASTSTFPDTVTGAGQILRASGANAWAASTATFPDGATQGDLLCASAANIWGVIAGVAVGSLLRSAGVGAAPAYTTATFPATVTGAGRYLRASGANAWAESTSTIPDTFTQGDLVYASAANVLGSLADVAIGQVLTSGGVGATPAWSASPSISSLTVTGNASIGGDLVVTGTTISTSSEDVRIGSNYLALNDGYMTAVAQTGGTVVNYLPTATADTVAAGGFTAGVPATSNPTVATAGAATFALHDIVEIAGATNDKNNGLFEVLSHVANVLTVRGVGTVACVEAFTLNQFVVSAGAAGNIRKVTVTVLRTGTDGLWEQGKGAVTGITYGDFYSVGGADVAVTDGGTGLSAVNQGDIIVATGANSLGVVAAGTASTVLKGGGAGTVPAYSTSTLAEATGAGKILRASGANAWAESTITIPNAFTQGDLVVATGANILGVVADVAVNQVLTSGGVGVVPAWSASPMLTNLTLSGTGTFNDAALLFITGAGTVTGDVVQRYGGTVTEGFTLCVYENTVSPNAINTNLINTPANSVIYSVQANCQTALTGGSTTATWSIGIVGTVNKYGTAGNGAGDTLAKNGKLDFTCTPTRLAAAEQMVLVGAASGGAPAGDTALTVGSVRVRVVYATCDSLDDNP